MEPNKPWIMDTELRLRMNLIKCGRFKTIQSEPPNRKVLLHDEIGSLHHLRVLSEESDLDKATDTGDQQQAPPARAVIEEVEEEILEEPEKEQPAADEEEKEEEVVPEVVKPITGVFRDDERRIDVVLVVQDDSNSGADRHKLDFITNILKTGLEVEIEPGLMDVHKHLSFILIHGPDDVLNEYGNFFAVKRYFVDSRLDLMAVKTCILKKICNIFKFRYHKKNEMEWLKIMRGSYSSPGYSNYERSLIVYKILRHLPFGDCVNQYGLHRLLKRNVVLDAYPLHDGPYFHVAGQTAAVANGRQLLYYYWTGLQNLFHSQPLHLIHEYFGPKVAFYYVFYGFYNTALALASIAGVWSILMRYVDRREPDTILQAICKGGRKHDLCAECTARVLKPGSPRTYTRCYDRPLEDYCTAMAINAHLDHPYVPYFAVFMMLWPITCIAAWRCKEYVLNWMWEVGAPDSYYETSTRPEFEVDYQHPRRSARTGYKYDESGFRKAIRVSLPTLHSLLCIAAFLPLMDECKLRYDDFSNSFVVTEKQPKSWDYFTLAAFQTLYTLLIIVIEKLFQFLHYHLLNLENHKRLEDYEKSLIRKRFELSLTLMYPFMCWYAWSVGRRLMFRGRCQFKNMYPIRALTIYMNKWMRTPWESAIRTRGHDCRRYCWPFTCINELSVLLLVTLALRQVMLRLAFHVSGTVTDYNEDRAVNAKVPWWEREYKLKEFNEATLTGRYMLLAVQFSLVTFFVIAFPLAPLLMLVVNVWDLRHSAKRLVLATRRPLLIRSPGIGGWSNVFLFVAYAAILVNTLTLVATTRLPLRQHFQSTDRNVSTILDFSLYDIMTYYPFSEAPGVSICGNPFLRRTVAETTFPHATYILMGTLPERSGFFGFQSGPHLQSTLKIDYFVLVGLEIKLMFLYGASLMAYALFVQFVVFRPHRRDVCITRNTEFKIKNLYHHYNIFENKKLEHGK